MIDEIKAVLATGKIVEAEKKEKKEGAKEK